MAEVLGHCSKLLDGLSVSLSISPPFVYQSTWNNLAKTKAVKPPKNPTAQVISPSCDPVARDINADASTPPVQKIPTMRKDRGYYQQIRKGSTMSKTAALGSKRTKLSGTLAT